MSLAIGAFVLLGVITVVSLVRLFYAFLYARYMSITLYYLIFITALGPLLFHAFPTVDYSQLFTAFGIHTGLVIILMLGRWSLEKEQFNSQTVTTSME